MKKMLLVVSAVVGLLLGSSAFADLKVGVVDAQKVFLESPQMIKERESIKKKLEGQEKKFKEEQEEFQKTVEAFSKNSSTMKEDVKKTEQQKIMEKQKKLQELYTKLQGDSSAAQEGMMKSFVKEMETAVNKIVKDKGLDLVITKTSVAYHKKELEITDEVLKQMKK